MTFPERLLQLKQERKLLQKDIAASIGLSLRGYQLCMSAGNGNPAWIHWNRSPIILTSIWTTFLEKLPLQDGTPSM